MLRTLTLCIWSKKFIAVTNGSCFSKRRKKILYMQPVLTVMMNRSSDIDEDHHFVFNLFIALNTQCGFGIYEYIYSHSLKRYIYSCFITWVMQKYPVTASNKKAKYRPGSSDIPSTSCPKGVYGIIIPITMQRNVPRKSCQEGQR